ncbi:TonB-dependent receptor domain-containing protein [Pedobacter puniceum]|uniref:TonB-dependent receptor n=1 Tax=Pedobacter puniceum TaxID=2666136 RepID=A0A7K0FS21_9SPHI|nr:TonB-dependent receptor [Pedobacter puniceum]MRX48796.1 TonB-dependent receptor [Pedobacter puniceum]
MKKKIFALVLFLGVVATSFAQYQVKGRVLDSLTKTPIEYASIGVFSAADAKVVNGKISDEKGAFNITGLKAGVYHLKIDFIGYQSKSIKNIKLEADKSIDFGIILLKGTEQLLSEVKVESNRNNPINKIDKQVFKADQFESARGGTAIDVIRNMPSITVNGEGDIRLRGSTGFLILLNGKPVQTDAVTLLNQIPANAIENIEIITAPSAKYDADGKSGIINITTKRGAGDGLSYVVNVNGGLPSVSNYDNKETPKRYGADATINYQKNEWELSFGGSYQQNDLSGQRVGDVNTTIGNRFTSFPSTGERSFDRTNYSARASLTYTPDKANTFNAGFYAGQRKQFRQADINYNNRTTDINTGNIINELAYYNANLVLRQGNFVLGNLDYTHSFKNKSTLTLSGLYEHAKLEGFTKNNNLNLNDYTDTIQYVLNTGTSPLNAVRLKLDYAINLGKGKLESGYQLRYQEQTGSFLYQEAILRTGRFTTVPEFSDDINVINNINAFYTQYAAKAGKLEYTGGLRYEYATRSFKANKIANPIDLNLSNFFPSLNFLYTFDKGYKLKGGFSRRVQRSTNNELNPYAEREHSETLEQGDPTILPEFINLTELGLIKDFTKGSVFATLYNQQITNVVNRVNSVYADTVLNRIYTNAGDASLWGIETGLNVKPTKWWSAYLGVNIYDYQIKGALFNNTVAVNNSGLAYSINTNHSFSAGKNTSIQFNLNYLSERPTAQGEDSRFIVPNSSVKQSFLNGRLTASLLWQNMSLGLINTNEQRITTRGRDFFTTTNYIHEKDIFMINLSFNLNPLTKKLKLPSSEFGEREF